MKIKKGDIVISISLLLLSLIMAFAISQMNTDKTGRILRVEKDGELLYELPLDKDREIVLKDSGHYNRIIVKDGKAYMGEADCRDKVCLHMYPISEAGETIICLPNRVFLEVVDLDSDTNDDIDKVVR
ncbi:NusG domain II-containing protein [uncultured Anaerococcus sp.]|uniref:NusG domain II-containing protein n=1 Tax=uncultured Anaerococcus sp. TaxID=293428 RepID=UPI0026168C9D|nr:NusG domain II-containing protein [uncultured Anaerococcus sp.]